MIWSLLLWDFFMEEIYKKSIKQLQTGIQATRKPNGRVQKTVGPQAFELRVDVEVRGFEAEHCK